MGFRFRRRLKIFPGLWDNLSKRGGSLSVGGRGATINVSKKGVRERGPLVFRAITYGSGRLFSPRISAGGIVSV